MIEYIHSRINQCKQWLLPNNCLLCQAFTHTTENICAACKKDLPWLTTVCQRCANPLVITNENSLCGACLKNTPKFDKMVAVFTYQQPIIHIISALKFNQKLAYAKLLSDLMIETIQQRYLVFEKPNLIIPIPLHKQRLQQRGFNQAVELAKPIAKKLNIEINYQACVRVKATHPQSSMPAKARANNMKNAFALTTAINANHVAIVDDVVTTGSTVLELCKILRPAGIARIDVWCFAKTILQGKY